MSKDFGGQESSNPPNKGERQSNFSGSGDEAKNLNSVISKNNNKENGSTKGVQ